MREHGDLIANYTPITPVEQHFLSFCANDKVAALETQILQLPQVDLNTSQKLSGGIYARTVFIPAGIVLTGAKHKREHINIVFGDITVTTDDGPMRITGHKILESKPGFKRAGVAHSDTIWITIHRTDLVDFDEIEDDLTDESNMLQTRLVGN